MTALPSARRTPSARAAWVCIAVLCGVGIARAVVGDGVWLLLVWGAYTPFVWLPAYVTLGLGIARRRVWLTAASLALVVTHLSSVVPQAFLRDAAQPDGRASLRVITANGNGWNQHPGYFLRSLARHDAAIVCLQEVSPAWAEGLRDEGWLDDYPYQRIDVREGVWGMALLSRLPLTNVAQTPMMEARAITAQVEHAGASIDLLCAHPAPPTRGLFESHHAALERTLAWAHSHATRPAVALGDFNSTPYSSFSRRMRVHMDDAWELAGPFGLGHTWPNSGMLYPPARLDHIYVTGDLDVSGTELGFAAASDHQPVVANIVLRAE
jgi:endonuclease/exonuclease/phosphatase (EEP) superfamily protein YafD